MASIVAAMSPERMNRWLLIGAAGFALIAGALMFAVLANVGSGDGDGGGGRVPNDTNVLVANGTITAGTVVTADMFEVASFSEHIVPGAVSNVDAIVGSRAAVEILDGQQVSTRQFIGDGGTDVSGLAPDIPEGTFAYALSITEETAVGGLIVPGDRIDIIVRYSTKTAAGAPTKTVHIEPFATNVLVLARGQEDVDGPTVTGEGTGDAGASARPDDVDPDPGAATLTLALTPEQVLGVNRFEVLEDGEISVALRRFGDPDTTIPAEGIAFDVLDGR